ncbi:hypothetical protein KFE98_10975 [bacterium SCSIO 12741]|nr:hypothetical protein KFE98_10975 [bacterium SCSIO 12741]
MSLRLKYGLLAGLIIWSIGATAQKDTTASSVNRSIYRKSWNAGFILHTHGIGVNFRKERYRTALRKNFFTVEMYNYRHNKEQRTYNPGGDESNSFIYGKLNFLFIMKGGVGHQRILFSKDVIRGVQISTVYNANLTLGFLKPVYLEVLTERNDQQVISTERYDPGEHRYDEIVGKGPFLSGFNQMEVVPGLSAKFGLNFEFSPKEDKIKAIETGINVDAFMKPMPIMAHNEYHQILMNVYINFVFGKKSYL